MRKIVTPRTPSRFPKPNIVKIGVKRPKFVQKETLPAYLQKAQAEEQRYAGDALEQMADDIIGELRDEAAYEELDGIKDMVGALNERDSRVNAQWDQARELAGVTSDQTGDVQLVGNISNTVPEAVSVQYGSGSYGGKEVKNETRLHTKFEKNPLTGQMDVVPFVAKGESQPLITEFGLVGDGLNQSATEGMDSDEFLGKRLLQLMGMEPQRNNSSTKTAVDLVDKGGKKVDVEILKTGELAKGNGVGMQVYTQINPASGANASPRTKAESVDMARGMVNEMRPVLEKRMIDKNLSMTEAVDELTREGYLSNAYGNDAPYTGKLFKDGGKYADNIVYPVMTNDEAFNNLRSSNYYQNPRGLVQPLSGAYYGDVQAAAQHLEGLSGKEAVRQMSVRPLPGNDNRTPSGKVYLQVPTSQSNVVLPAEKLNAAVQQLFRNQQKKTPR
jgi:hypothetical protein